MDISIIRRVYQEMLMDPDMTGQIILGKRSSELARLVQSERAVAIGWTIAWACSLLDAGEDPRRADLGAVWRQAKRDLASLSFRSNPPRTCRVCGRTGGPYHWVEDDLCSACVVDSPKP